MIKKLHAKSIVLLLLVIGIMGVSLTPVSAATKPATKPIRVYVQEKEIKPTVAPVVQGGRVYVEFRSVVQALGFKFKYDAVKKVITADSEDAAFKIDLKTGTTFVNGGSFSYDNTMIIDHGINTLVMTHLFNPTDYINASYNSDKKSVNVYEDPFGKPKKADISAIRAVLEQHYQTAGGTSSITSFKLDSWGTYSTILVDVNIRKSGNELLDRIEHASIEMNREDDNSWTIHDIQSEVEYLEYKSLSQKETTVPEADKSAIFALLEANQKAHNEENAEALIQLLNPAAPLGQGISSKEELELYLRYTFLKQEYEYIAEASTIVAYEPNKATVYAVYTIGDKADRKLPRLRFYSLMAVVKASDGKWYLNPDNDVMLNHESL